MKPRHPSISDNDVMTAVEEGMCGLASPGFCNACGDPCDGVEPDAQNYECETCGEHEVFGAEEFIHDL